MLIGNVNDEKHNRFHKNAKECVFVPLYSVCCVQTRSPFLCFKKNLLLFPVRNLSFARVFDVTIVPFFSDLFANIRNKGPNESGASGGEARMSNHLVREWWAFTSQYWPLSEAELKTMEALDDGTLPTATTKYPVVRMQPWGVPLGSPAAASGAPSVLGGDSVVISLNCRTM